MPVALLSSLTACGCQGFAANVDLLTMVRPCTCRMHQRVHSFVSSGPRRGESRATISGAYPAEMCGSLVRIIKATHMARA